MMTTMMMMMQMIESIHKQLPNPDMATVIFIWITAVQNDAFLDNISEAVVQYTRQLS